MNRAQIAWLGTALAVPLVFWLAAPRGAEWTGSDDRLGELAKPAGRPLFAAPEHTPGTERALFLVQAITGGALLAGSLRSMKRRRQDS